MVGKVPDVRPPPPVFAGLTRVQKKSGWAEAHPLFVCDAVDA
jgi:hypothetical protein